MNLQLSGKSFRTPSGQLRKYSTLVEQPQTLTLDQVKALPAVTERVRMKCVECWSAPAAPVGTGVTLAEVFKLAQPTAQATHVRFYATDATVQPGFDRPLDLGGIRPIAGGEQTY